MTPQIVVVGSHGPGLFVRVHRVPAADETVVGWDYEEPVDGAKGSNQAVAASRLGTNVSFVGCVGQDRLGDAGLRWLKEAEVDTTFVKRSPDKSTVGGFVMIDDNGLPAIVALLGANGDLGKEDVENALGQLKGAKILLTQFEIRTEVALFAARLGRQLGLTTIVNPAPVPEKPLQGLEVADYLTPNENEAKVLLGKDPTWNAKPEEMAQQLRQKTGAGCVMITLGERGVVAAGRDGSWHLPAPKVTAVDTTGAGDAFNGALAVGLVRGLSAKEAANEACMVAAYSVTKRGTIPIFPTQAEVQAFFAQIGRTSDGL